MEIFSMTVAVAFFGVPHGATDHLVASDIFKGPFPRTWLLVFVLVYLFLMGLVILAWNLLPSASLAIFLLLTIVHWGLGDVEDDLVPARIRPAAVYHLHLACAVRSPPAAIETVPTQVLVHGAIPIVLPCVAFRPQVGPIFTWLVSPANSTQPGDGDEDATVATILTTMQVGTITAVE
jgi:Brp/Blh family beta-carotene 15,15'-monooxygenase